MQTIRQQFQGRRMMRMASTPTCTCTSRSVRRSSIPGSVYLLVLACISISVSISIPTAHAFSTNKRPSIKDGRTSSVGLPAVSTISSRSLSTPTTTTAAGRPTCSTSTALRFSSFSTTTMGTSRRSIPQSSPIARCRRRRHHRSTISTTSPSTRTRTIIRTSSSSSSLVTEDNVLEAVEEAEQLWAQALDARKTANALSDRAEEGAEAAAATTLQIDATFQTSKQERIPIRMEDLAKADAAAKSNLDAGSMVNRAMQASEEAEEMERVAEEALQRSEKRLEQHLQDFPDSALAQ